MPDESPKRPVAVDFTIGDWLVEPSLDRLSRGETVVHLRPQLTDLLVVLARQAGRTVPKEVILQEVWATQFVGESGLTRCIAEIRQALGDDARQPKILETIPKRGYRLVAPVVFMERPDAVSPSVNPLQSPPADPPQDQLTPGEDNVPTVVHQTAAVHLYRVGRWVALAVAVPVGIVAIVAVSSRWTASAPLTERSTVLLADVRNDTGDPVFDATLHLALAVNLEQAPFLRILPEDAVRSALVRAGRPHSDPVVGPLALDLCRREGAAVLLAGSIAPLGSRYAVGLEATACASGEGIGRAIEEANGKENVLTALERAATRIRMKLGESRASLAQHSVPLIRATTPSLEALNALTKGDFARDHARLSDAYEMYKRATQIDPNFALAWARRAAVARNVGLDEETVPALKRAYELRDRVSDPERFYIEAHYYRMVENEPMKAIETYQSWMKTYPDSEVPPTNIASILSRELGQYEAAIPMAKQAIQSSAQSSISHSVLIRAYLGSNRLDEARKAIAEAERRGADDRLVHMLSLDVAMLDGNEAAVERETKWASRSKLATLHVQRMLASKAMAAGRWREARQLFKNAVEIATEVGPPRRVAETYLSEAEGEALLGDPGVARSCVEAALSADKGPISLISAAMVLALVGDVSRAASLLDDAERQSQAVIPPARAWLPTARALLHSASGRPVQAADALRTVIPVERASDYELIPMGVHAFVLLSAHRPQEALAAFDALLQARAIEPSSPWVAFARLGRARALHELGDVNRSLIAYEEFFDSWKNADVDAQLLRVIHRERSAVKESSAPR